ncbi:peptidase M1 [Gluconobacter thailandicus]|uniref:M1 family metallopeptidase n=1 Tax=Gluconobacter thailandicus TaxID=257438 RepID=UPI000776BFAC|nr:peptidase M1 [Gluconobacter thailandicus]
MPSSRNTAFQYKSSKWIILCVFGCLISAPSLAETSGAREPDPSEIFAPLLLPDAPTVYRSGDGTPGPMAWKNQADYRIHVQILPEKHLLSGQEEVRYQNNSPSTLPVLWVQLDQNIYKPDSRAAFASQWHFPDHTSGMTIKNITVSDLKGKKQPVQFQISDTRLQIVLPEALKPHSKIRLQINWDYTVPGPWGGRTAVSQSRNGEIYEIAQFYPRMAVFDDIRGWDTLPYLGDEFYLDYGNIDYDVTVPDNFIVAASGALLNPQAVLSPLERARLQAARLSEKRVLIRTQSDAENAAHHASTKTRTWHFLMQNTRDVAFVTSPALLWDAARLDLPPISPAPGYPVEARLAMSVYPIEAAGPQAWDRSTEYVKHTIEYFSHEWYMYPWPNAVNVGGHGAAMEYPGIVFDGMKDRDAKLFWITTHELGHSWFPMIVGSNERRNGFMDEGFNTFIDALASLHFNKGEFAPKHDGEYAPDTGKPADDIVKILMDPVYDPIITPSHLGSKGDRHAIPYFKAAYGLELLRSQILGPERFDRAFRHYIEVWAYRHPTPSDFFRLMNSDAGEDLSWFWRGWYFKTWFPDYAIEDVKYTSDAKLKITILNKGWLPLPLTVLEKWTDGTTTSVRIPTEVWSSGNRHTLEIPSSRSIAAVIIDPDHAIPDVNRSNNEFFATGRPTQ